jgi:DNA-binding MarR family transcriptional regulator
MLQSPHQGAAVAQTRGTIDRVLAMLEQRGLSPTEVRVLLHLLDREASLVEIANALGHPPGVITGAGGRLDSRGLVRWFHAAHTKESRLAITADGVATMRALLAAGQQCHDSASGDNLVVMTV